MIATNALITNANGLATLVAPLSVVAGSPVSDASGVSLAEVATDLVVVKVARLRVLLREMGAPVPRMAVPSRPVPTATVVVAFRWTMTVAVAASLLVVRAVIEERIEATNDDTEADVADTSEADVFEAEMTESVPDPPVKTNWPE